jgi:beta-lactamase regulating signal transducer with metallopeptidase domain
MSAHLLLEAAARTLVMGAIILVALRALRIEQVRARRTAWLLALAGALAMPALVAAQIGPRLLPDLSPPAATAVPRTPVVQRHVEQTFAFAAATPTETALPASEAGTQTQLRSAATSLVVLGYCLVATILALRLCAGIGFALRLVRRSERRTFSFDPQLDVRSSSEILNPVTVASSVLLPVNHTAWDEATLRIVLTHERAHVRQKDFYVQALAGLHCALFWFNPFSWWLRRQLSELGEALSDCAAVEQAESRTSYAEILLAFANHDRSPRVGVAMASPGNLTSRIERLLSDRGFERSFARKERLPLIAAGVVMLALVASTSMVRVRAAPAIEIRAAEASTSVAGAAALSAAAASTPVADATPASAPPVVAEPPALPALPNIAPAAPAALAAPVAPVAPAAPALQKTKTPAVKHASNSEHDGGEKPEEGVVAIHTDRSNFSFNSGNLLPQQAGDYIYFQHNGKPYLIEDPEIIAKAQTLLAPMKELGEQQRMLGHQQALLGAQQRMLVAQSRALKMVDSPEFKRELADIEKSIKDMKLPELTAKIDQHVLAEIQAHLGEIQARVGRMQGEFGVDLGQFGEQQGKLGEQQGKLGEQQAQLGEQQRKIIEDVRRQLEPIIEQAIREGKGKLLIN